MDRGAWLAAIHGVVDLQCCVNFCCTAKQFSYVCVCVCVCVHRLPRWLSGKES